MVHKDARRTGPAAEHSRNTRFEIERRIQEEETEAKKERTRVLTALRRRLA